MVNLSRMRSKVITIFLASSFYISFAQTNENIIGLFGECKEGYFACSQIEFKSDSTFEYDVFFDVGGWQCWTGRWSIDSNIITINTFSQPMTEEENSLVNQSYSFVSTDFITDLKFRIKKNRLYIYDFEKNKISNRYYFRKTSIDKKEYKNCNK